ncbi:hypothetical protein MKW94_022363 [Papaver nudicaule]|uniref:non-specific serine/threonine protein kinase n=1 Tax=Papaver nudicaule TaxID=74823 RepID=A0AA41RSG5_PAPNU|nr:hypothetical protein [Papaver nudicaule]
MASLIDTVHRGLLKLALFFGMKLWLLATFGIGLFLLLIACCSIICRKSPRHKVSSYPKKQPLVPQVHIDMVKTEHQLPVSSDTHSPHPSDIFDLGWVHRFTLREIIDATNNFSNDNIIKEGGCGSVYRGILPDATWVAVKWYFGSNEFISEIDALRRTMHKNLVTLLGYCLDGSTRMLVCEYVDSGNLHQWLHKDAMKVSPLTWDIRLDITIGIAKALSYLHEGLEQKIVHSNVTSCKLLDQNWNPKVADFGLSRILDYDMSHVTTPVLGTYGYVAPEYACTGILSDRSDVYSFGVLIMELVSGKSPEDMSLVDWLKKLIETQRYNEVGDPKMPDQPSSKALKSVLLVAFRCIDPDAQQRPKMSQIVHMLESTYRFALPQET